MRTGLFTTICAVVLLAAACGGMGGGTEQVLFKREKFEFKQEQPVLEYGVEHAQPAPEIEVDMFGVPALAELPAVERNASNEPDAFLRYGAELAGPSLSNFSTVDGDYLIMSPDWNRSADPPTSDLAWALYGFALPGYSEPGTLQLWWAENNSPAVGNLFIGITDHSSGRWQWFQGPTPGNAIDFGDLSAYFSETDEFHVAVVATGTGSYALGQLRIGANLAPVADFTVDVSTGEVPLSVNFDAAASYDLDGDIISYEWDLLGDGNYGDPQTEAGYSHSYSQVGNYLMKLRVTDNEGATALAEQLIVVSPVASNEAPTAVIGASATTGEAPLAVSFNGTASSDPDGSIVMYEWDLDGDGSFETDTGNVDNVPTVFNEAGSYDVKLRVTDDQGSTDTDSILVEVSGVGQPSPPVAVLRVDNWFQTAAQPFGFDAADSTDPDDDIVRYEFDWENDSTFDLDNGASPAAQHSFANGTHTVAVRVTDSGGRSSIATVEVQQADAGNYHETEANDDSSIADPLGGYADYADGFSGWRGNLGAGGYDGSEEDWYVFTAAGPQEIQFDLAFLDSEADIDLRLFHADDLENSVASAGSTTDNETLSYSIPAAGTYFLRVFIWDSATDRGPADYEMMGSTNQVPVVSFSVSPSSGNVPFAVNLDATGSYDPDGTITMYEWDVDGNGSFETDTGTTSFLDATMEVSGLVECAVRVTDDAGGQSTATFEVNSINTAPDAQLSANPLSGDAPLLVSFDASASSDPDGHSLTLYEWDFDGDGSYDESGPDATIQHSYFNQGTFEAAVRVSDEFGASDTASVSISVNLSYDETEDNDTYQTGNTLPGVDFTGWFGNIGVDGPLDGDESDWMRITVPSAGEWTINFYFTDSLADLDMRLYGTDGTTELDSSTSTTDNESITYDFPSAGTYYLNLYVYVNSVPKLEQDYMLEMLPTIP